MKQMVLIVQNKNNYFPLNCDYADIYNIFRSENKLFRAFRKAVLKFNLPMHRIIFTDWEKVIKSVNEVIVFDTGNAPEIIKYLNRKYPNLRVILWYWNSISDTIPIESFTNLNVEIWAFDPEDVRKYGIKGNTQFYIEDNFNKLDTTSDKVDVFYVGADKNNRGKTLSYLKRYFDQYGISYNFNLVQSKNSTENRDIKYKAPLTYPEVVQNISRSKVIIDLVAEWQSGLTLRPLEALYFKKKLITNMKNIVDYDFYNSENIFILGVDNIDDLTDFINSEYDMSNYVLYRNKYSFREWLKRFDENESVSEYNNIQP